MPLASARLSEAYTVGVATSLTADPAANVELTQTVPAGQIWELSAVNVTLVTDATAPVRQVTLVIDDGVNTIAQVTAQPTQAASLTYNYNFAVGGVDRATVVGLNVLAPLPGPLTLPAGSRIRTVTSARAATDNYGPATILAVRYSL